jgi:hypothetical protein
MFRRGEKRNVIDETGIGMDGWIGEGGGVVGRGGTRLVRFYLWGGWTARVVWGGGFCHVGRGVKE